MTSQLLYLIASLAGVAAMVGLCVALFGRSTTNIDAATATDALRADVPGFRAGAIALSADGHGALVEDAQNGATWLVIARGSGLVTRKLSRGFVRKAKRNGAALNLSLTDFTFRRARLVFGEEAVALEWETRFARLGS
ncbi:MAG TPA: hypothetical protein VL971_02530 [Rhizomicrobium sp.]|nr:hypothetical protein [Rhizomicrobium sp.]